jgi:hypothetical protein
MISFETQIVNNLLQRSRAERFTGNSQSANSRSTDGDDGEAFKKEKSK